MTAPAGPPGPYERPGPQGYPQGNPQAPGPQQAYYPQQAHYAPGWQAPVPPPAPPGQRAPRRTGTVLALVGGVLVIGLVAGLVTAARYFLDIRPLGDVDAPRSATTRQLAPGHCLDPLPVDGEVVRVTVVPCDEPHEAEVVGVLALRGDDWLGQDEVDDLVTAYCEMDTAQRKAGFQPVVWSPSEAGWGQGDRRGLCLAWLDGGAATGSFTSDDQVTVL